MVITTPPDFKNVGDFKTYVQSTISAAKQMLQESKAIPPAVLLIDTDNRVSYVSLQIELPEGSQLYPIVREIVRLTGAIAYIVIMDAWMKVFNKEEAEAETIQQLKNRVHGKVHTFADKVEALAITAVHSNDYRATHSIPYTRDDKDNIVFGKEEIIMGSGNQGELSRIFEWMKGRT